MYAPARALARSSSQTSSVVLAKAVIGLCGSSAAAPARQKELPSFTNSRRDALEKVRAGPVAVQTVDRRLGKASEIHPTPHLETSALKLDQRRTTSALARRGQGTTRRAS